MHFIFIIKVIINFVCNVQSRKNVVVHCIYVHLILWNDINKFPQICIKMQYFVSK